jgi:hypothetical protein
MSTTMKFNLILIFFSIIVLESSCSSNEKRDYYANGKLKSIVQMVNGLREGERVVYDSVGQLISLENFHLDSLDGECKYFEKKELSEVVNYKNGLRNGVYKRYSNGKLADSAQYRSGILYGKYFLFYPNIKEKKIAAELYYLNVGRKEYLYYIKKYDLEGKLLGTASAIDLEYCLRPELNNLLEIKFKIYIDQAYDSAQIVIGDLDSNFKPVSFCDTVLVRNKLYNYKHNLKNVNFRYLRGVLKTFRTEVGKNSSSTDSLLNKHFVTSSFFEIEFVPKKAKCDFD